MSNYLGDFALETTFDFKFTTVDNTGLPVTLSGGVVDVYEDNSITELTGAETLTLDFDGRTGLHNCRIAATTANGFQIGSEFQVVVTTGTIGGVSAVGYVVGSFSIENRAALMPTTNGTRLDVSATGEAGIDWANIGSPSTAQDLAGTDIQLADTTTAVTNQVTADVTAISGSAPSADNLETVFNGNEGFYTAYLGPRGLGVYLDDAAANTNTVNGVDGTVGNPVSTIGAAKTLADSMALNRIYFINDTNITLVALMEDYEFVGVGENSQVNLGSQDVDNSAFWGLAVTGTQGGTGRCHMHDCELTGLLALECFAFECTLTGNNTLRASTNILFDKCASAVAGNNTPEITFPGAGTTNLSFRHYSGGLQFNSAISTDTVSYESDGQLIIAATCTSLTIVVRGNVSITDSGVTTNLTQDAALSRTAISADVNTEVSDVFKTDTISELGVAIPAATPTFETALMLIYMALRNKLDTTSTLLKIHNDAGTAIVDAGLSDNGTTFTRDEMVAGT